MQDEVGAVLGRDAVEVVVGAGVAVVDVLHAELVSALELGGPGALEDLERGLDHGRAQRV